jgi:N-acyl homoserine lactone hydrolase
MVRLFVLPCGYEDCDKGTLTLFKDSGKIVKAPYHVYLIDDPDGVTLVDTGSSVRWKERHPEQLQKVSPVHLTEEEHLDRLLSSIGFTPDKVNNVINTHLHYDHCGNNEMFPRARFYVNELEMAHALAPGWWESFNYVRSVFDIDQLRYEQVSGEFDVTPSIRIIPTPGHTAGHQSVVVSLEKTGTVVLAGDAVYLRENLDDPILPGIYVDAKLCAQSMSKLKHLVELKKGTMLLSHSEEYMTCTGWRPLQKPIHVFE